MTVGVICSLASLAVVIIGHICSFAYVQGQNNNRLKNLEEKTSKFDDCLKEIGEIKEDIAAIKTTLDFLKEKVSK